MLVKEITYNLTNLTSNVISIDNLLYLNPFGTTTITENNYNELMKLPYFKDLLKHSISSFMYKKEKLIINNTNNNINNTTNNIKTKRKKSVKRGNATNSIKNKDVVTTEITDNKNNSID